MTAYSDQLLLVLFTIRDTLIRGIAAELHPAQG